jgi:hypothetical protein
VEERPLYIPKLEHPFILHFLVLRLILLFLHWGLNYRLLASKIGKPASVGI